MLLTIIKEDNRVYVDRVSRQVDCSDLPEDFHALQWDGSSGWIEFVNNYKAPEQITTIEPYQKYIDEWNNITS
jgi:hypothetical protein